MATPESSDRNFGLTVEEKVNVLLETFVGILCWPDATIDNLRTREIQQMPEISQLHNKL